MLSTFVMMSLLAVAHTRFVYGKGVLHHPSALGDGPGCNVYDMGHAILPDWSRHGWWLNSLIPTLMICYLVLFGRDGTVREVLEAFLPLYLVRMVTTSVTIFPSPTKNHTCRGDAPKWVHYIEGNCFDTTVSGHTILVIILSVVLFRGRATVKPFAPLAIGFGAVQAALLLACRGHYTVDVVLSGVLTYAFLKLGIRLPLA